MKPSCKACIALGSRFERLVIVEIASSDSRGQRRYLCQCDCGGQTMAFGYDLKMGKVKSCGCLRNRPKARGLGLHERTTFALDQQLSALGSPLPKARKFQKSIRSDGCSGCGV